MPMVNCLAGEYSEVKRLEDLAVWWPEWQERWPWAFQELPGRVNVSGGDAVHLTEELRQDILDVYAEDLSLWEALGSASSTDELPRDRLLSEAL